MKQPISEQEGKYIVERIYVNGIKRNLTLRIHTNNVLPEDFFTELLQIIDKHSEK